MNQIKQPVQDMIGDKEHQSTATLYEKLVDVLTPGFTVELDPDEAFMAGAFIEDALSEEDATLSSLDAVLSSNETPLNGVGEGV